MNPGPRATSNFVARPASTRAGECRCRGFLEVPPGLRSAPELTSHNEDSQTGSLPAIGANRPTKRPARVSLQKLLSFHRVSKENHASAGLWHSPSGAVSALDPTAKAQSLDGYRFDVRPTRPKGRENGLARWLAWP